MKLVKEHINEMSIKHLKPKSEQEIQSSMSNLSPEEKLRTGAQEGLVWLIKDAISEGADIHIWNDWALRYASDRGHAEVVKFLLNAGADVHANNDAALRWASDSGHVEVVKLLLSARADIHVKDELALKWSNNDDHSEVVKLLRQHGNIKMNQYKNE